MRASAAVVALAAAVANAQTQQNYTSELDMKIDPNTVDPATRVDWCTAQTNTCNTLCSDNYDSNTCDAPTLTWNCTCTSNHSTPGIQFYTQTVPWQICIALNDKCFTAAQGAPGAQEAQEQCNKTIGDLCASMSPPKEVAGDSSSTSATGTGTAQPTGSATNTAGGSAATTSSKGAGPTMAPLGTGAFAAAMGVMAYML